MGLLDPAVQQSRVTSTLYYTGSPFTGQSSADYDIRDTAAHIATLPLASAGVVDMGLALVSSLTRSLGTSLALSAAGDTVTKNGHGLAAGQQLQLANNTAGGVSNATNYYVLNPTTNTFQLATFGSASPINVTSDGTADVIVSISLWVQLIAQIDQHESGGSASQNGVIIFDSNVVNDMPNGGRYHFLPEVSPSVALTPTFKAFAVPELRTPLQGIRLSVTPRAIPDTGTLTLRVISRY